MPDWEVLSARSLGTVGVQALVGAFGEARIKFKLRARLWPFCTTLSSGLYSSPTSRPSPAHSPRTDDDHLPHAMSASSGSGKGITTRPLLIQSGSIRVSFHTMFIGARGDGWDGWDGWDWRNCEDRDEEERYTDTRWTREIARCL